MMALPRRCNGILVPVERRIALFGLHVSTAKKEKSAKPTGLIRGASLWECWTGRVTTMFTLSSQLFDRLFIL